MAKTTEFIGKVARMCGNDITKFLGPSCSFSEAGLSSINGVDLIQVNDNENTLNTFAVIIGECDPDMFTSILTKEEVNELIRSWFTPEYMVTHDSYFKRYLDFHMTPTRLDHIDTLEDDQAILAYLKSEGFKFIRVTTFDGPQFDIPAEEA